MGDHFVLLVDRLLTESTLEAAIESRKSLKQAAIDETLIDCSPRKECEASLSPRKLVECRICQDEDIDSNMETPCSCCGSLKVGGPLILLLLSPKELDVYNYDFYPFLFFPSLCNSDN